MPIVPPFKESTAAALEDVSQHPYGDNHGTPSILGYAFVVAFVAGFGFFVLSFVVLGILPAIQLQAEINRTAPHSMQPLTASEEHGRIIYGREGCGYCHTEQVRTITQDVQRFVHQLQPGKHSTITRSSGVLAELGRTFAENGLRTDDWHYAHLFNPRSTVPDSIMPSYSWMFDQSAAKPKADALDLVAYVRSLGRDAISQGIPERTGRTRHRHGDEFKLRLARRTGHVPRITAMGLDNSAPVFASPIT